MAPRELDFPGTMTDLARGTWVVSSASVIQDGETIMNGYACDLDKLSAGSRLGLMRKADGTLHFFVNGEDCGAAASSVPPGLFLENDIEKYVCILLYRGEAAHRLSASFLGKTARVNWGEL